MDLDKVQSAASKAFGKMDKVFKNDSDLEIYDGLSDEKFQALADEFGADQVTEYINQMEYRRLNNGKAK